MQMAKIKGYKVIGTTSKSKEAIGRATGVDELIVCDEAPGTSFEDYTRCSSPPTPQPPWPLRSANKVLESPVSRRRYAEVSKETYYKAKETY